MTMRKAIPKMSIVMALILLAAIAGATASSRPAANDGEPRLAKSNDLALRVTRVLPSNGAISAYEPVVVEVEITNTSSEPVGVYWSGDTSTRIEVRDSHGTLVGGSPVYPQYDVLVSSDSLVPGQSMRSSFIPSAVYQFKNPGGYRVRIMLLGSAGKVTYKPSDLGPVVAEATVSVKVQPFDEARLKARCDELVKPRMLPSRVRAYFSTEDVMALWSVHHNAALHALKYVAIYAGDSSYGWQTAIAIRRIRTPESAALLKALRSRKGKMGRVARSVEKADLSIHDSDYFADWTKVRSPEATVNEFLYYFRHRQWEKAAMLFNDYFRRKHAAQLKNGNLFSNKAGKSVGSVLNDPRSKALRSRKEGKFVIVDVGLEASDGAGQIGIVHLQLIGGGSNWHLSDFPGLR